jgi:hypothetical protein
MRHAGGGAPQARSIAALALGVALTAGGAALISRASRMHTAPPSLRGTPLAAIALPAITVRAQAEPSSTPLTAHRPQP